MRSINHKIKPYLIILLFILVCFLILLFSSCNPEKQLQKKEDKAVGTVLGSQRVFPQVGAAWLAIHPCVITTPKPDSIITKIDTLLQEKKVFIPVKSIQYKDKVIDTIIDNISIYADSTGIFLKNLTPITNTTKTIIKTIIDQTKVNNLTDSLNASKITSSTKDGIIQEKAAQLSEQKKTSNRLKWYLGGSFVLLILSHIIRSYAGGMFSSVKNLFVKS